MTGGNNMFTISMSCFEFDDFMKLADHAGILAKKGIGVELCADSLPFFNAGMYKSLLPGIHLGMHCPMRGIDIAAPRGSAGERFFWIKYEDTLKLCQQLQASYMVVHTLHKVHKVGKAEALELSFERLQKLIKLATDYGVEIWIENVGTYLKGTILYEEEEFIELAESLPGALFLVDIGHAYQNGWDALKVCRRLGSKLRGLHVHDNFGVTDLHLRIGSGSFPLKEFVYGIPNKDINFVMEYLPTTCDSVKAILDDIEVMNEYLKASE